MFFNLLLLFIVVPIIELLILFRIGGLLGAINTFTVIIITGVIGAYLAKRQGLIILKKIQTSIGEGKIPAAEVVDGLIILVAGAVLLTPGFLTDITGFLLLLPFGRNLVTLWLIKKFTTMIKSGKISGSDSGHFAFNMTSHSEKETIQTHKSDVIDVESRQINDNLIE